VDLLRDGDSSPRLQDGEAHPRARATPAGRSPAWRRRARRPAYAGAVVAPLSAPAGSLSPGTASYERFRPRLHPGLEDHLPREPAAHDLADLGTVLVALHLLLIVA